MNTLSKNELAALLEIIADCTNCGSFEKFHTIAQKFENLLQSTHLVFLSSKAIFVNNPSSIQIVNVSYPAEWIDMYLSRNYIKIDPIMNSRATGLLYWEDIYEKKSPDQEFHSEAKSYGIDTGYSHIMSNQQTFGLMSAAGNELNNTERIKYIIDNLAPHFHQLVHLLLHKNTAATFPNLTPREQEVLLWTMEGKSNWEISVILGVSQESIKCHVANTMKKVGASNRAHAVAIALQHKLLCHF